MSTTRRDFLAGVGAAAVATTAGVRAAGYEMQPLPTDMDHQVAASFCVPTQHDFLDVDQNQPHAAILMYGLVCLDPRGGELLLPNTTEVVLPSGHKMMEHHPRVWSLVGTTLTPWDTAGYAVDFRAVDGQGAHLTLGESLKTREYLKRRPWCGMRWVRHLKSHTGRSLLKAADRDNPIRVSTRVALPGGRVIAVPPHTRRGSQTDWRVTRTDGTVVTQATTDAMLWTRQLPSGTAAIEVTFRPIGSSAQKPPVRLPLINNRVTLAVTHAHPGAPSSVTRLEDTCAFAQLLTGITPAQYPIPEAVRGARPALTSSVSGDDGHCECACA